MLTNRIEMYFSHQGNGQPLYLQSGDENSRYLELVLKQYNGTTFEDIDTADYTATMVYRYSNSSGPQSTGDMATERQTDGSFLTLIPIDPLLQTGTVYAQLSLRKLSEEKLAKSAVLVINVLTSYSANAEYTEQAVTQLTAILSQIEDAVAAAEGAAAATAAAQAAADAANAAAALANTAAAAADAAAAAATTAAGTANSAAANANAAAAAAAAAAAEAAANAAAAGADTAAAAANTAASTANTAAAGADTAAAAANAAASAATAAAAQAISSKTSIKTIDKYADYATLQSSVPSPTPYTDYYAVGASDPYDIYVYTASGWLNLGPIGGAGGLSVMPAASVDHLDRIVQYIGTTGGGYTNGYFYKCQSDGGSGYEWVVVDVGPYATLDNLAPEYTEATYALGVFRSRQADGKFYECTTEITSPEAWNAAHWTQRDVGYVLNALKTLIDGKASAAQGALADTAVQPATIAAISSGGVETGGAVSQLAAGPGQGVDVPEVWYISPNGKRCHLAAKPGLAAGAADVTHGQIDIVYGPDTPTGAEPIYVSGTPSASPEQPATPANGTLLAVITRYAGDDTIADADIEDRRDYITKPEDFEDETEVTESSNTFALDLANKHTQNFYFTIDNTTGKTVTASSAPYGTCDIILTIKMTATAAIIWTLDGRSTTWAGAEPTWTSGYTYHVLLSYSTLLSKWILTALPGAAN